MLFSTLRTGALRLSQSSRAFASHKTPTFLAKGKGDQLLVGVITGGMIAGVGAVVVVFGKLLLGTAKE
jgi:hypothetical protein